MSRADPSRRRRLRVAAVMDLIVAASAAVGILGCAGALSFVLRRSEGARALARLPPVQAGSGARRKRHERRALLASFAEWFRKTGAGARFAAYVTRAHPHVAFSDAIAMSLASLIAGFLLGTVIFSRGPLVLVTAAAGPVVLDRIVARSGNRRTSRVEQQLPETLALQASALRAGHSTVRSLRIAAAEIEAPLGEEVELAVSEIDLGSSLDHSLMRLAARVASKDVDLWVTAMLVHRVTGGNLSTILDALAARVRERAHVRGEIRALTAQGRLSGTVVAAAPLAFFVLLSVTSRDQMQILYSTPVGFVLLALGLGLIGAGFAWIRWIVRIKA